MTHPRGYRHPQDGSEMVLIPAGRCVIGSAADDEAGDDNDRPLLTVGIPGYYIGLACVTNAQ